MDTTKQNPEDQADFVGFATVYNELCDDGKVIAQDAFSKQDGTVVPLVWIHGHQDMRDVLGHGTLKHVAGVGMRLVNAKFNSTDAGKLARTLVKEGDIRHLSVYANKLVMQGNRVVDGVIREVSLVLAGANPKASIDQVVFHSSFGGQDDHYEDDGVRIWTGRSLELLHATPPSKEAPTKSKTLKDILNTFTPAQKDVFGYLMADALGLDLSSNTDGADEGQDLATVYASFNQEQLDVVHILISEALASEDGEDETMTHNVFANGATRPEALSHSSFNNVLANAIQSGADSLRDAFNNDEAIAHAGGVDYGITNIESLFPEAKFVDGAKPYLVQDDALWVGKIYSGARMLPYSRIKSTYADITVETARARGYITADQKFSMVYPVFNRKTTPQTVYIHQELDRDDILDITDFNVVLVQKEIMQIKLREEVARAVLFGDDRPVNDPNKINPENIRPIYGDDPIYTHVISLTVDRDPLDIIDDLTKASEHYEGDSGTLFTTVANLNKMLLVRDTVGHRIHRTKDELAGAMGLSGIVTVPQMKNIVNPTDATIGLFGIIVNMRDYAMGADSGGSASFFEDFDLKFNKKEFLLETRICGALVKPKTAIAIEQSLV